MTFESWAKRPLRVLVIDDSDLARAHLCAIASSAGMEVFEQTSAIGATRTILRNEIEVVIVDISMPGLSGDRLIQLLRDNKRFARLAIVVVSAKPAGELAEFEKALAVDAVLSKERAEAELSPLLRELQARLRNVSYGQVNGHA
ncbi:MAG TPA: response regulator [Polyangiaceae bacterium]|nr:response regulator [Polyangiaceae bacterium]